ncbi:MAG TPA: gluconate:H+ symporter [Bryobacteraceae bacterium]|nr:gluconate:H+ symporter [Bryobacteraceae bacterium]
MPDNGSFLLSMTLGAIALLLFLILAVRLHAFLALLISSMALGLAVGMEPMKVIKSIQAGFGDALGFIAVVVALGAMIGRFLEHSGGGRVLADWLLNKFGKDNAVWAVLTAAFLVGLPIFFEVGFIILVPLAWSLARESKKSLLFYGLPMTAALTVTHAMVPPHPAPSAAASLLGADLGRTILYGAILSIPMAISGGIIYGRWIANRLYIPVPEMASRVKEEKSELPPPSVFLVILVLLLPVMFIFAASIADIAKWSSRSVLGFLGHPFSALLITALFAMYAFGVRRGLNRDQLGKMATDSLAPIGTLLAIMGGGGAFKQIIVDSGVGPYAGKLLASSAISPLVVAYLVAAAMRMAQGSATVAIITAAGIVAPLVKGIPGYTPEMIVLALSAGGTILSHVNDAGFWIVNEYFGMTVPQTLQSWTTMKVITSIVGITCILTFQALFG